VRIRAGGRSRLRVAAVAGVAALAAFGSGGEAGAGGAGKARPSGEPAKRDVLVVSNNWAGTADIVDPHTFRRIARINVIPDKRERIDEIHRDPVATFYFNGIRNLVGEGHNQYVDDGFVSGDGRLIYFSRPSFADVVAIKIATGKIAWRVHVDGYRADHMALSPDGRHLLVSASTANVVDEIDTRTGEIVGSFPSGDSPHENNFSRDGKTIFNASIGFVYTDADDPSQDETKGKRYFEIVDAKTLKVKKRINMAHKLAEYGVPGMSAAVRPMAISPDERFLYFQLSFFNGFVEYDLKQNRVTRLAVLPFRNGARRIPRTDYILDSAQHGLAMNPRGTKLCVAGTMDNYAAIVRRSTLKVQRITDVGIRPYWSTPSADGRYCFVSVAGNDRVAVISYDTGKKVADISVGNHPQRMRTGRARAGALRAAAKRNDP
jgi:DNA-binding beta-propeller fold protein YncE